MTISSRAMGVQEMPEREQSIAEKFRIVALQYVDADGAASLLEELKTTTLAKMKTDMMADRGDVAMTDAKAERLVKSGDEWPSHIKTMVEARTKSNKLKLQLEYLRMLERQEDRASWLERSERKMGRSTP